MNFNSIHNNQIQFFESILFEGLGKEIPVTSYEFLSGGNINNAVKLDTAEGYFFVKWNESDHTEAFAAEAKGLQLLRSTQEITLPHVITYGHKMQKSYIMLEYISSNRPQAGYWEHFGRALAKLHTHTHSHFGLDYNNFIGSLKQSNEWEEDGIQFFIEKRLKVQAGLALYNGEITRVLYDKFDALYEKLPNLLPAEKPALLHGDLWSGNVMIGNDGWVCLIDPAVYYGNREAELAFTKLFGGFNAAFYQAYMEAYPVEKGFEERIEIYNLYPLLVHVNLFGSGYLSGIEKVLKKF
ncbi:fructosamine kinase family protein [Rhodocytophaga aerolata]|uniref:Fructosamine kinase family protein n=1 Tax=Rhodocytophaga aerolata TaxID=455078 RepID=A0ABT8RB73_9BACT|nr:fructosamine kinase family protein [Rhodocytophaga aerolata]MDO1448453.1 fructosamine kinase family protein [Rhodocytophaga aerolata]